MNKNLFHLLNASYRKLGIVYFYRGLALPFLFYPASVEMHVSKLMKTIYLKSFTQRITVINTRPKPQYQILHKLSIPFPTLNKL